MTLILSDADLSAVHLADDALREAVEAGLVAQAAGHAIAEPTVSFHPVPGREEMISVIRGALPDDKLALVKAVGGFPENGRKGLPSNPGFLSLIDTETGAVTALLSAARITSERTAMVTAIGARRLAPPGPCTLAVIGTRGVALQAVHYIARGQPLSEIRIHSRSQSAAEETARDLAAKYGIPVIAAKDWMSCLDGADILIDGAALAEDRPLFPAEAIRPGVLVIVYGAYSSLSPEIMHRFDRLVVDRWTDDGRGALGRHLDASGRKDILPRELIGSLIAAAEPAARPADETVIFNHRGVAACDIALANLYVAAAGRIGLGISTAI